MSPSMIADAKRAALFALRPAMGWAVVLIVFAAFGIVPWADLYEAWCVSFRHFFPLYIACWGMWVSVRGF